MKIHRHNMVLRSIFSSCFYAVICQSENFFGFHIGPDSNESADFGLAYDLGGHYFSRLF